MHEEKSSHLVLTDLPRYSAPPSTAAAVELERERVAFPAVNLALFLLTLLTTTMAGSYQAGVDPLALRDFNRAIEGLRQGLSFSLPLMAILLSHELGHYFTARVHRVAATLPYFLPFFPSINIVGTFGAFIRMK